MDHLLYAPLIRVGYIRLRKHKEKAFQAPLQARIDGLLAVTAKDGEVKFLKTEECREQDDTDKIDDSGGKEVVLLGTPEERHVNHEVPNRDEGALGVVRMRGGIE